MLDMKLQDMSLSSSSDYCENCYGKYLKGNFFVVHVQVHITVIMLYFTKLKL